MSIDGEAGRTLPAEQTFIDMVLALVPDAAVIVNEDGEVVAANDALGGLFGYAGDELVGRPIESLVPERFRHGHRRDRSRFLAGPKVRTMGAGLELWGRRQDGSEFPVDISLAPIATAERTLVVAAVRDVSERRATEAAHAQLAAIVRSSLDAIVATTVDGRITSWNLSATRILGYGIDGIVGEHVSRLVPAHQSESWEELLDAARRSSPLPPTDTEWLTASGSTLPVAVSVSPLVDRAGHLTGFSVLLRDITDRKHAEAELRRLLLVSEQQARWQEVSAEVRLAVLDEKPLAEMFGLIAERAAELMGATAVVLLRDGGTVVGGWGIDPDLVGTDVGVSADRLWSGVAPASDLDLPETLAPAFTDQLVRSAEARSGPGGGVAILCRVGGTGESALDFDRVLTGLAQQAVLSVELERARQDRERVLLSSERERIARDLHDHAVQSLFATGMSLQALASTTRDERSVERINEAVDALDATIKQIRTAIFTLSAPVKAGGTLRADVLSLAADAARGLGFDPAVSFEGAVDSRIPAETGAEIVAVVREALSNAARHAHARRVSVELSVSAEGCHLAIADDGDGFTGSPPGNGLRNLRHRAEQLGGSLGVTSAPGEGTRLDWRIPLR